jgi:hypothetical protein
LSYPYPYPYPIHILIHILIISLPISLSYPYPYPNPYPYPIPILIHTLSYPIPILSSLSSALFATHVILLRLGRLRAMDQRYVARDEVGFLRIDRYASFLAVVAECSRS